jgi:hypothetical protein
MHGNHISRVRKMVAVGASATLAACSTTPTARPVVEKIVTVEKPIPVACVDKAKVPAEPRHVAGDLNGQAVHDLDVVSASAIELRTYGETLAALIQPCTKP